MNRPHSWRFGSGVPLVIPAILWVALAGCGGGATTGELLQPPPDDDLRTPTPLNQGGTSTVPDSSEMNSGAPAEAGQVVVAIVDSGFKLDQPELATLNFIAREFAGSGTLDDDVFRHGTYVAQSLAGQTVGATARAELRLAKAADSQGRIFTDAIESATRWVVDNGARVINYSLAPMYTFDNGDFSDRSFAAALGAAGGKGAVMVMSAGNIQARPNGTYNTSLGNISTQLFSPTTFFGGNDRYNEISLIVGAIDAAGNRQPYSFYPGGEPEVQARFLVAVAPVTVKNIDNTDTYRFNGTSATAPLVSAAAAEVLYRWPHLSAQETSGILLQTADQGFSDLYNSFNCGSTTFSCGHFYFGAGQLDVASALATPLGPTQLTSSSSVDGGGYSVDTTRLALPSAFGDALRMQHFNAVLFDAYGRDFPFGFQRLIGSTPSRLGRDWWAASGQRHLQHHEDHRTLGLLVDADGRLNAAQVGGQVGKSSHWTWARGSGSGIDALDQDPGLPMLSWFGQHPLGAYASLDRMAWRWDTGPLTSIEARSTFAHQGASAFVESASSAQRHEALWSFRPSATTRWGFGLAVTDEKQAVMGQSGQGALALDRTLAQAFNLQFDRQLESGWRLFGSAEVGTMQVQGRTGYLQIDRTLTSQWRAGMFWSGEPQEPKFGLALSQPLRVERATARFNLPVGRTVDGQVIRQVHTRSLAPSGRQTQLELALQSPVSGSSANKGTLGLNLIYAHDAGHVAGLRDWAWIGSYARRW